MGKVNWEFLRQTVHDSPLSYTFSLRFRRILSKLLHRVHYLDPNCLLERLQARHEVPEMDVAKRGRSQAGPRPRAGRETSAGPRWRQAVALPRAKHPRWENDAVFLHQPPGVLPARPARARVPVRHLLGLQGMARDLGGVRRMPPPYADVPAPPPGPPSARRARWGNLHRPAKNNPQKNEAAVT